MDSDNSTNVYQEFAAYTLGQLKDYLSARGLSCQGIKEQLVSRCFVAWESAVPLRYSEQQQAARIKEEYTSRLKNADIDDPRSFLDSVWSDDVKLWPTIDLGMIFSFILKNKEQDLDFVGKYKTQKAYSYYESGFVDVIKSTTVRDNTVIKSRVTPSQSVRNEPHEVWISIKANEIKSCWCSCIAGMAQTCNHVIAVLYKLEYATTMGYNNLACTSQPCGWNSSTKKDVKPCRLSELSLRCDNRSKVSGATAQEDKDVNANFKMKFDPRREDHVVSTDAEVENLYASLYSVRPKSVLFTGFPSLTKKMKYPDTIISSAEKFITSNINDVDFVESLSLSSEDAALIEITTRGQSSNAQWMEQRKGRITASITHEVGYKMSEIVKKKNVKTSPLVAKVCGKYKSIGHLESIKYGKNNEVTARNLFSILESQNHRNLKVDQCGLFVKADRPYIAASPDALVTCTCCSSKATLEIKCPISVSDISISTEGWKKLDYLEMDEGKLRLKQSHTHYTQVQTQMAVTGCKVAYFFVWSPKGSFCEKIEFNSTLWLKLQEQLCIFFRSYIVPVLLGNRDLCFCPKCENVCCEPDEIVKNEDNSVHCDCCDLWYHWKCISITTDLTQESWVCNDCLQNAVDL